MPCPEVVAISYIRPAEVPTLFSVEGDAQVKQKNHKRGLLTQPLWLDGLLLLDDSCSVS